MGLKIYDTIEELEDHIPWAGAVHNQNRIIARGKGREFIQLLEECYPDGITSTDLNDILWFDDEFIDEFLGEASEEE